MIEAYFKHIRLDVYLLHNCKMASEVFQKTPVFHSFYINNREQGQILHSTALGHL